MILILMNVSRQISSHDYPVIENKVKGILKEKQPFERLVMTKENLLKMFEVQMIVKEKAFLIMIDAGGRSASINP